MISCGFFLTGASSYAEFPEQIDCLLSFERDGTPIEEVPFAIPMPTIPLRGVKGVKVSDEKVAKLYVLFTYIQNMQNLLTASQQDSTKEKKTAIRTFSQKLEEDCNKIGNGFFPLPDGAECEKCRAFYHQPRRVLVSNLWFRSR